MNDRKKTKAQLIDELIKTRERVIALETGFQITPGIDLKKDDDTFQTRLQLEDIPLRVFLKDRDSTYLSCNSVFARDLGISPQDIVGKTDFVFYPKVVAEKYRADDKRLVESGRSEELEESYTRNGQELTVHMVKIPVRGDDGCVAGLMCFFWDITEERRIEETLHLRSTALEAADNSVMITDTDGRITWVNPAFVRLTGFGVDEVIGKTPGIINSGIQDRAYFEDLWETILFGQVWHGKLVNRRKNGTLYTEEMTITPVKDESGNVINFIAIKSDITERKRAREAMQESEELFRATFESAGIGMVIVDVDGHPVRVNNALENMLGYTAEQLCKMAFDDLTHPEDALLDLSLFQELVAGRRRSYSQQKRFVRKDGSILWGSLTVSFARRADSSTAYTIVMVEDITERKKAEESLRTSQESLAAAQKIAHLGSWETELATGKIQWSGEFFRICGMEPDSIQPTVDLGFQIIHPDDREKAAEALETAVSGDLPYAIEKRIIRPDGSVRYVHAMGEVIVDEEGNPSKMVGTLQDITERKTIEDTLYFVAQQGWELEGASFLTTLVQYCAERFDLDNAFIILVDDAGGQSARTVAFYHRGKIVNNRVYSLANTPCADVIRKGALTIPTGVQDHYPSAELLAKLEAESYAGVPLWSSEGRPLGILGVMHRMPLTDPQLVETTLQVVAVRAAHEIERMRTDEELRTYQEHLEELVAERTADIKATNERLSQEIVERENVETALRQSEAKYRGLLDALPQKVFYKDRESVYLAVNPAYARDFNTTPDAFIGKTDFDFYPEELARKYRDDDRRIMVEVSQRQYDEHYISDGLQKTVHTVKAPVTDDKGNVTGILGIFWDITERKRAEEALRQNEEQLKSLLSLSKKSDLSEQELVAYSVENVVRITGSKIGYLHFVNPDQKTLSMYMWSKGALKNCTVTKDPDYLVESAGIWAECIRIKKPVIHNFYQDLPGKKGYPEGHIHIIRHTSVPVIDEGKIVAIAGVGNKESLYTDSDTHQLSLYVNNMWEILKRRQAEEALKASEENLRLLFETMEQGVVYQNADGNITSSNPAAERILGLSFDQARGHMSMDPQWKVIHEDGSHFPGKMYPSMRALRSGKPAKDVMMGIVTPDEDEYRWIVVSAIPQFLPGQDKPYQVYSSFSDVTGLKRAEGRRELHTLVLHSMLEGVSITDFDGNIIYTNPAHDEMFGYEAGELIGQNVGVLINAMVEEESSQVVGAVFDQLKSTGEWQGEFFSRKKDRAPIVVAAHIKVLTTGGQVNFVNVLQDITERKQAEKQINKSLQEKEILLREIHHRVKNNLNVVHTLLDIQASAGHGPETELVFREAQKRIRSIAMVHEYLYQSEDLTRIDFGMYVKNLLSELVMMYGKGTGNVTMKTRIEDVTLTLQQAVPCGLIISELATNTMKYAFPHGENGELVVRLYPAGDGKLCLLVGDDGVGLPEDIDIKGHLTLGLRLVYLLSRQLKAELDLDRDQGTKYQFTFPSSDEIIDS